jgi:hypothetical protein
MAKLRKKKTTKAHAVLKKSAAKVQTAKSKRGVPKKAQRKHANAASPSRSRVQAATIKGDALHRDAQEFPLLWPALGLMRMWLGPRKSTHT